jgi:plasmid stabilization system protein ParE
MYQVEITEPAKQDIRSSFKWWRDNRSTVQADRWYRAIHRSITSLRKMPERCGQPSEADLLDGDMRQLLFGIGRRPTHRIIFTVGDKVITILRIRHSSQDALDSDDLA